MMRKDVKIGFAIGGILVAVLIVYVLAVSGGKKHDGVQLAEGPTPTPATPGAAVADRPTEATDPFKQPASDSPSKHVDAASAPPSIPPEKSEPRGTEEDKWMLALSRGTVPMMTTTPARADAPKAAAPSAPKAAGKSAPVVTAADEKTTSTVAKSDPAPMSAIDPPSSSDVTPTTQSSQLASSSSSSSPAPKSTKSVPAGSRTHVVAANETITKIALAAYGNANFYPHILRANPDVNPNRMKPGTVLVLPSESEVKGGLATSSSPDKAESNTVAPLTVAHTAPAAAPLDPKTQYEVQPGDSLQKISTKLYGTMSKWQAIYDLNKATIGTDPAKVKAKSILKLPEPPTVK